MRPHDRIANAEIEEAVAAERRRGGRMINSLRSGYREILRMHKQTGRQPQWLVALSREKLGLKPL